MLLEQRYNPENDSAQKLGCSSSPVNTDTDTTISIDEPSLPFLSTNTKSAINGSTGGEQNFKPLRELPLPHMPASPLGGTSFDLVASYTNPFGQGFDVDQQDDYAYSIPIPSPSIPESFRNLDGMPYLATPENSPASTTSGTFYQDQYASSLGMFPSSFPQVTSIGGVDYCASAEIAQNAGTTSEQFMQWQQRDNRIVDGTLEEGKIFRKQYPECKSNNWATPNSAIAGDINGIVLPEETANAEIKRQVHIQTEQKRRAQIKDGFEELKKYLPSFINKKMSKAAILHKTIQYLQQLKANYLSILREYDNAVAENLKLKNLLAVNTGASHSKGHPNDNPGNLTNDSSIAPSNPAKDDAILGH